MTKKRFELLELQGESPKNKVNMLKKKRANTPETREKCPRCSYYMVKKRQHGGPEWLFWRCTACSYRKRIPGSNRYGTGRAIGETVTTTSTLPPILRGWNKLF